jgi:ribosomal protein S18 acetylase RimI-like enzyme
VKFRHLTPDDYNIWRNIRLEALSAHPQSFLTTYEEELARPESQSNDWLASGSLMGAFDGDDLCAVMSIDPEKPPAMAHRGWIHTVYCRPNWRGGPMSRGLMDYAIAQAKEAGLLQLELYVEATNTRAIAFYERFGFQLCGRIPRAVRIADQFQDDLHYWLPLDHALPAKG